MLPWLLLKSTRPRQWIKNLLVFAALVFSRNLRDTERLELASLAFVAFCAASGAVYLINDILDRDRDRQHPTKRLRPIAAGRLPVGVAWVAAFALGGGAVFGAFTLSPPFGPFVLVYILLQMAYSTALKHVLLLDVLVIAIGFMLRAIAGAVVIDVPASSWLVVTTLFAALFLALSKRRAEVTMLGEDAAAHRKTLGQYPLPLLDQLITISTALVVMCYALYTFQSRVHSERMVWSIPLVVYGVFRYLYLVYHKDLGASVEDTLLGDAPLLLCVGAWAALMVALMATPLGTG